MKSSADSINDLALFGGAKGVRQFSFEWPVLTDALRASVDEVLRAGGLGYGADSVSRRFETAYAAWSGRKYAVATNSGTSALLTAYVACGFGETLEFPARATDDMPEVIVGAFGFFATASALLPLGVRPVFCDVDPITGTVDPNDAERMISPQTRGIAVTHLAGHAADMERLMDLCRRREISLVEDCSHAHGSTWRGRNVGTFGAAGVFSLQSGKLISGGEGGVVVVDDDLLFRRCAEFANFRRLHGTHIAPSPGLEETGVGLKLRIGPLEAALAGYHLSIATDLIAMRNERLERLSRGLAETTYLRAPKTAQDCQRGAFYEYHLSIDCPPEWRPREVRACVVQLLKAEGVEVRSSNTKAIYRLPLFEAFLKGAPSFPNTDRLDLATICLPTFTLEPIEIVDEYIDAIRKVDSRLEPALRRMMAF